MGAARFAPAGNLRGAIGDKKEDEKMTIATVALHIQKISLAPA
jgi:hypothetical protein